MRNARITRLRACLSSSNFINILACLTKKKHFQTEVLFYTEKAWILFNFVINMVY